MRQTQEKIAVSDDDKESVIVSWFKGLGLKIKLLIGAIVGLFGVVSIFLLQKKMTSRQILELELKKLREEIEIERAKEEIDKNNALLLSLEERANSIKEEIQILESFESDREVTNEELDEFFDDRGF